MGRQAEGLAREIVSKRTIYAWKAKHGGLDVNEAHRLPKLRCARRSPWTHVAPAHPIPCPCSCSANGASRMRKNSSCRPRSRTPRTGAGPSKLARCHAQQSLWDSAQQFGLAATGIASAPSKVQSLAGGYLLKFRQTARGGGRARAIRPTRPPKHIHGSRARSASRRSPARRRCNVAASLT